MKALLLVVLIASCAYATSTQEQITALLQTGTKASDAIETVFQVLNDLKQSNIDTQYAADLKNETDEMIGSATIAKFTEVMNLNRKLFQQAIENREFFEEDLKVTKAYLAWNEQRQDEISRKMEVLQDNQCYSNQLFVRSIKMNQEALETVKLLKQDVAGYVTAGESFELNQMEASDVKSMGDKLKMYQSVFSQNEIHNFLELANQTTEEGEGEAVEDHSRGRTLAERVHSVLEELEENLHSSLDNLKQNEIAAAWELAGWLGSSEAEVEYLKVEYERKSVYADRCATQIQAALAQQAKTKMVLQESQNALDQVISDLNNKRESYAEEKAKRDEENLILDEVIIMFKNQVASWSGR